MKNKLLCFKILGNIKMSYVENHIKLNDQFNHLCEKDTRNEISFLEGSFEWAKRRGLVTFGLTIAIFPLAILAPLGDEKCKRITGVQKQGFTIAWQIKKI
jgi:hypothetical protein